jgi:hypothetical protein
LTVNFSVFMARGLAGLVGGQPDAGIRDGKLDPVAAVGFSMQNGLPFLSLARTDPALMCYGGRHSNARTTGLFSLRSAEFIQGFFVQAPNLSQVPLRFFNVVPDGVQLVLDSNLVSMIQRSFEALEAKCGKGGEGISLLYSFAG